MSRSTSLFVTAGVTLTESSTPQRPGLVVSGGEGGAVAEGEGIGAAGAGGVVSGGAGCVGVKVTPVEVTAASSRRPRPASSPGFPSVPWFPPRSFLRPIAMEPWGVPAEGTGGPGDVGGGGAGAGGTGTVAPTLGTIHFMTRGQRLLRLEREERERAEEEPQEQQQGQVPSQQTPEEAEKQRLRLRDLPDPALARLVHGPLPSPPIRPIQSLSSSQWTRRSPLSHAVSPEPRRSRYHADGLFHLVLCSRVPPPPVLPQPPESSLTVFHDLLSKYLRASRPVISHFLSVLVTHPSSPPLSVSAIVTTIASFASSHHLDYAAHLVNGPARSLSSGGVPVFPLEVLEDRQFELGFLAAAVPYLCAMLLAPEGDPDALDIPIPRTHAEAVSGPWASYWIAVEETEMESYRSTGTYVDAVPPPETNVISGMWLYKRATSLSSSARPAARHAPSLPPPFSRARPILPSRAPSFSLPPAPRPSPARPSAPLVARGVRRCRAPPPPLSMHAFLRSAVRHHHSPLLNSSLHSPPPLSPFIRSTTFPFPPPPILPQLQQLAADFAWWLWLLTLSRRRAPSHTFPPPLISPLSSAAADYSANIPPPLISPLSGAAANYSAHIPPPLISPLSCSAADYFAIFLRLLFLPSTALLPSPSPPMGPILTTPSRLRRYCPLSPAAVRILYPSFPYPMRHPLPSLPLGPLLLSRFYSLTSVASPLPRHRFPSRLLRCLSISLLYSCRCSLPCTLDFVLDSGAIDFVFRDASVLRSFPRPLFIHGAGETMTLTCTGTSSLPCPASPSGAVTDLYVPSCRHNLLSLSALQCLGVRASFPAGELYCDLHYQDRHLARFTLSPTSRLYTLRVSLPSSAHHTSPTSAPPISSCDCRSLTQPTLLLHHCLGHPNFPLLRSMVHSKPLHDLPSSLPPLPPSPAPLCTPCVQAKHSQSPHPSSASASPQPLDLVHMDLWGPSPIASRQRHRYFLLLVDDHSCFATVYPLHAKSDAPSLIIRWAEQARLRFGRPVARFHSDGGGEFFNNSLSSYCSSHGIR
ncbi:unnamed protein product [Closterium sp. NIES-54]